jgi:hypothetical protein
MPTTAACFSLLNDCRGRETTELDFRFKIKYEKFLETIYRGFPPKENKRSSAHTVLEMK